MSDHTADAVHVYWRQGCGYCVSVRRALDHAGIERIEHNIWDDPGAAAIVREHAGGNETVPTVVIGGVGMVNPTAKQVVARLAATAPHLLPEGSDVTGAEQTRPGVIGRLFRA